MELSQNNHTTNDAQCQGALVIPNHEKSKALWTPTNDHKEDNTRFITELTNKINLYFRERIGAITGFEDSVSHSLDLQTVFYELIEICSLLDKPKLLDAKIYFHPKYYIGVEGSSRKKNLIKAI